MAGIPLSRVERLISKGGTKGDGFNDFIRRFNEHYRMPLSEFEEMLGEDYILDSHGEPIQDYLGRNIEGG